MPRHTLLGLVLISTTARAEDAVKLAESFAAGSRYNVELRVDLAGKMTVPVGKELKPQLLSVVGASVLSYDERVLPPDDTGSDKILRKYRGVEFRRTVGDRDQQAGIRAEVRRLVVVRSSKGKSPFSPDGPLTWQEIDVVKNDIFCPVLVPGLLPGKAVRPGDQWLAASGAVTELTDMERVTEGGFTVKYAADVVLNDRPHAKLAISGTAAGVDDDGPCRHTIDGTAYFDRAANVLTYLSIRATHELLNEAGKPAGRIDGRFVMTRSPSTAESVSDAVAANLDVKPSADNTQLLYDNPDLGVRFVYPRRWRVGAVQGRQVTLDGPNGAGVLISLEPPARLPTAAAYRTEVEDFLRKEKAKTANASAEGNRFGVDAEFNGEKVRMEWAVVPGTLGGATLAARLPAADAAVLTKDVDRVLKQFAVTKAVK